MKRVRQRRRASLGLARLARLARLAEVMKASRITTGSNRAIEYAVALARARMSPAAIIQPVPLGCSWALGVLRPLPALTTHQADSATPKTDIAS